MRVRGDKRLLVLAAVAAIVVAPLGALAWHTNTSQDANLSSNKSGNQNTSQISSTPKSSSLGSSTAASAGSAPVSSSKTTITINDRQISLSPDGHTHQVIQNAGGTTTLDVSVSNNVSGNAASSHSSNNVSLYSSSVTSVGGQSMTR